MSFKRSVSILLIVFLSFSFFLTSCSLGKEDKEDKDKQTEENQSFSGESSWEKQVIMTIELSKFKSAEEDDNNLNGDNSKNSNDFDRFTYALDEPSNRSSYEGGIIGGDLIGLRKKVGHLKDIGITTALLYPVYKSDRNNLLQYLPSSYGISDWRVIDRNFRGPGEPEDDYSSYINLINDLHNPEIGGYRINVIQDLPIGMSGREHPWFLPITSRDKVKYFRYWNPDAPNTNLAATPMFFETRIYIDLSKHFNEDVFSYKTDYTDGSIGSTSETYPAEDVGNHVWILGNNFGYEIGNKINENNNAIAGSVDKDVNIDIPGAKYATLGMLAAATNGNKDVTIRVQYDDGTYTDNNIIIPDWESASGIGISSYRFSRRYTKNGPVNKPVYMHSILLDRDPTKVVTSITLLKGGNSKDVHIFGLTGFPIISPVKVDLTEYYNADGISYSSNMGDGSLNDFDALFPAENLKPTVTAQFPLYGKTEDFTVGPKLDKSNNLVNAKGQTVTVPVERYHMFNIAAFSTSKDNAQETFTIKYTDGSSEEIKISIKHIEDPPKQNDISVHYSNYLYANRDGDFIKDTSRKGRIWGYTLKTDWNKEVESLVLPENPNLYIAAINPVILIDNSWGLPVLEHTLGMEENSDLFNYMWEDVIKFWFDKADLDGFRIDSAQNFKPEFWSRINQLIKDEYKNKVMFGEVYVDGRIPWQLKSYQYTNAKDKVNFDAIYAFEVLGDIQNVFGSGNTSRNMIDNSINFDEIYEEPWNQVACFNNYEGEPLISKIDSNKYPTYEDKLPILRLAAAYLFTINRVPMLFSGDEYLVSYGAFMDPGSNASKPGYLFSDEVQKDPLLQDNYEYMKALIKMRKETPALSSKERMTNQKWVLKGHNVFGFIRQEEGESPVIAVFNNSEEPANPFAIFLPSQIEGDNNWNFIKKDSKGSYGAADSDVEWTDKNVMKISNMEPWEAKIIKIQK